eukprot:4260761-Lingulodinium_polyedra.AAC.1
MDNLWTLLLAYAFAGARLIDPAPADRPAQEDCVEVSIKFVECPLDVVQSYFDRATISSKKVPRDLRLDWVTQRDVAERTKWVEKFRNSKYSLGTVIRT